LNDPDADCQHGADARLGRTICRSARTTAWTLEALEGKEILVITTAGAEAPAYSHEGCIGLTIQKMLAPVRASANHAGRTCLDTLAFSEAAGVDENRVRGGRQRLSEPLRQPVQSRS